MHAAVFGRRFLNPFRVIIQSDECLLLATQKAPDGLSDAPVTADHRMVAQLRIERGDGLQLHLLIGFAMQAQGDGRRGAQ